MGLFGPHSCVGLDLGTYTLKVAGLVRSGDGVRVERIGMARTPPGAVSKGVAVNPEALVPAIYTLFQGRYPIKMDRDGPRGWGGCHPGGHSTRHA